MAPKQGGVFSRGRGGQGYPVISPDRSITRGRGIWVAYGILLRVGVSRGTQEGLIQMFLTYRTFDLLSDLLGFEKKRST